MKRLLIGIAAIVAMMGAPALAADMALKAPPAPQVYDWTGFYVGGNVGYAWGHSDASTTTACGTLVPFYFNCGNQAVVEASGTGSLSSDGFTGGVQAGYNWQADKLVYGAEIDFGALNLKGSRTATSAYVAVVPGTLFTTTSTIDSDWLMTARGRLGWTVTPQTLIYATGGLALTRLKVTNTFVDADPFSVGSGSGANAATKAGWTLGGGAEWMLAQHWSVKAEYLFVDFGSVSSTANVAAPGSPGAVSPLTTSSNLTAQIARVGLNYKF